MKNAEERRPPHVVILAGGAGRGMKTDRPKLLTPVFFRPMIHYVLDAAAAISHRSITVVAGAEQRKLEEQCRDYGDVRWLRQETPRGTADALLTTEPALAKESGDVLVLSADRVLVTPGSLRAILETHAERGDACTVAAPKGGPEAAVYCFRLPGLFAGLRRLAPGDERREYRLEEAVRSLAAEGAATGERAFEDAAEAMDIDDLDELSRVETILRGRFNRALMRKGVSLRDPATTVIDPRCRVDRDVVIEGGATVLNSTLEAGAYLESGCRIVDSEVGANSRLLQGTRVEKSRVGRGCQVGPYAHLRSGTNLSDEVRVGNFVEIKNSTVGAGTKVSHLSYIGDASIGRSVNVGCGFVTCNYDGGPVKQRTVIEDGVFIGSASQAIAPVTVGARSFIATGTSITEDVPPESFVISRGRQITKPGYARKYGRAKDPHTPPAAR
jgi:bifunctional UDP-N-acetylglucosamine pyrophosphorylase/glucosamine-1-phosphate N-acetyltransferase